MSSDSIEQDINETLLTIKKYIDAAVLAAISQHQIPIPKNKKTNVQFSMNSIAGLPETLDSIQKKINTLTVTNRN